MAESTPRRRKVLDQLYDVQAILRHMSIHGTIYYLVKWAGYDDHENTWQPADHLLDCPHLVEEYHRRNRRQRRKKGLRKIPVRDYTERRPREPAEQLVRSVATQDPGRKDAEVQTVQVEFKADFINKAIEEAIGQVMARFDSYY